MKPRRANLPESILKYILALFGIVALAVALPVQSAVLNPLEFLCKPATNAGLVAAVCELRDRIIILEKKPVSLGSIGPQGERGQKGERGPQGKRGTALVVKQASGEAIGYLVGVGENDSGSYRIWHPPLEKILSVDPYDGSPSFPETRSVFYYESEDCSGPPFKDTSMLPYYIYRLEGDNPYGWTHVTTNDFSKIKKDAMIRSQWEGNPEICMKREDVVGVVSELIPVTPPLFTGPLTVEEE